jgi:sensor domain CHASE-containing protein
MVRRVVREVEKPIKRFSERTYRSFQRQLKTDGRNSLIRSKESIEGKLLEHIQKLKEITEAGGRSSSVEREIRTFESQLEAIRELLK